MLLLSVLKAFAAHTSGSCHATFFWRGHNAEIKISIPDWFAEQIGEDSEARERFAVEAAVLLAYRQRRTAARDLALVLGQGHLEFQAFLARKNEPNNFGPVDYSESLKQQEKFLRRK
jgi:hypothetical protein